MRTTEQYRTEAAALRRIAEKARETFHASECRSEAEYYQKLAAEARAWAESQGE